MHVYISVDMEGIAGIVHFDETGPDGGDYDRCRRLMTAEANAAVTAALDEGADRVVVNDSHGTMRNIVIEELDPRAELISGSPKPMSMVQGLDGSCDAALFIGYHSMAGRPGVLNHTYTGAVLQYRVNERRLGEIGMNAAAAGHHGVPIVFVSGDDAAVAEAEDLLPGVETAQVKEYVGRQAARSLHPQRARRLIYDGVRRALCRDWPEPYRVDVPVVVELQFDSTSRADASHLLPGAERVDPLTVRYTAPDYLTALRAARALLQLGV